MRTVLTILLTAMAVAGCMQLDGKKNEARISNRTGVPVEIFWTAPGEDDVHYTNIPAGQVIGVFEYVSQCAPANMVARTTDGKEVARTEAPLCPRDSWVIGPPG